MSCKKGQYFTTSVFLKESVYKLILNDPSIILEPSVGRGHLVEYIINLYQSSDDSKRHDSIPRSDIDFLYQSPMGTIRGEGSAKPYLSVTPSVPEFRPVGTIRGTQYRPFKDGPCGIPTFHMYEIDKTLKLSCLLPNSYKESIVYKDFLSETINCKYNTIIGNPPYVKKQGSNLYISFIEKCFGLLKDKGELIFIVPSNFIRLTSSKNLINKMLEEGAFTHILHPNIENLFEGAYIDVIVFRYCKDKSLYGSNILFNDEEKRVVAVEGILTFEPLNQGEPEFRPIGTIRGTDTCGGAIPTGDRVDFHNTVPLGTLDQYFDIFVGMVTGRDSVFKDPANQVE
jgi:hypothetical protein